MSHSHPLSPVMKAPTRSSKGKTPSNKSALRRLSEFLLRLFTTLCLAFTALGSGLFVCCIPLATIVLSSNFSQWEGSSFTHSELVSAAEATRDYTVGTHDRTALLSVIASINHSAHNAGRDTIKGSPNLPEDTSSLSTDTLAQYFSSASDSYVLSTEALSHLDDVYKVVDTARVGIVLIGVGGMLGMLALGFLCGWRRVGSLLKSVALWVILLFVGLAAWALIDFNGFFAFLHSLFFSAGTWTFSANSLLIRMYPLEFWIGMGIIWLISVVLICLVCFILGSLIKNTARSRKGRE